MTNLYQRMINTNQSKFTDRDIEVSHHEFYSSHDGNVETLLLHIQMYMVIPWEITQITVDYDVYGASVADPECARGGGVSHILTEKGLLASLYSKKCM